MIRCLLFGLLGLSLCGCMAGRSVRISEGSPADMTRLVNALQRAPVIFLGESHDQTNHHALQLQLIAQLEARGGALIIGLEMFDIESQAALDRWSSGELSLEEFTALYRRNWTIHWSEYDRILRHARERRIPLVGLNPPRDLVNRVVRHGFTSLQRADKARLPLGVTADISLSYRLFLALAFADHQLPPQLFDFFCQAQGLRNNTMARMIQQTVQEHPGTTMIVLAGVGHAMRRGVADALPDALAAKVRIVVPFDAGLNDRMDENDVDFIVTQ